MPPGGTVILLLKILVLAVTALLVVSLVAISRGHRRLHGRINLVFFILTMLTVFAFEGLIRAGPMIEPGWRITNGWTSGELLALKVHLSFVIPLTFLMPAMLYTGWTRKKWWHVRLAVLFSILWCGMLVTGIFLLPHRTTPAEKTEIIWYQP